MLISVTNFFHDRLAFEALERTVVAELFGDRHSKQRVHAWAAGCATGEEAYSLAMLLLEHASDRPSCRSSGGFKSAADAELRALP